MSRSGFEGGDWTPETRTVHGLGVVAEPSASRPTFHSSTFSSEPSARENAWLAATVLCRFAVDDADEEALVGGIIENHPDFIDEAPFNPWALVRDTLLSMRMRILCIKYLDMQATGSPSERERVIVCFWRAAPGEAGDVRYVERGEL